VKYLAHAGTITEILFNVNDVVPIGTVIARLDTNAGSSATPITIVETATAPIAPYCN
jgi:2-oxoglutarate dehydrogenase E2 component (dihydrolipoamide succinyltransferase)